MMRRNTHGFALCLTFLVSFGCPSTPTTDNHPPSIRQETLNYSFYIEDHVSSGEITATDQDQDALTFRVISNGQQGNFTFLSPTSGAFNYEPYSQITSQRDTITIQVSDGINTTEANVSITLANKDNTPSEPEQRTITLEGSIAYLFEPTFTGSSQNIGCNNDIIQQCGLDHRPENRIPVPLPYAKYYVLDADNLQNETVTVLATNYTDLNGNIQTTFNTTSTTLHIQILVAAELCLPSNNPDILCTEIARIKKASVGRNSEKTWAYLSSKIDVLTETNISTGIIRIPVQYEQGYYTNRSSAPFSILHAVQKSSMSLLETIQNGLSGPNPRNTLMTLLQTRPLNVYFTPDTETTANNGTYYSAGTTDKIFLLSNANNDSDEYDHHVIAHEWGHYMMQLAAQRNDAPNVQEHGPGDLEDARVAFSEGWANAFSGMALNNANYTDADATSIGVGMNLNDNTQKSDINPGWFSEASVHSLLYDLVDNDSNTEPFDTASYTPGHFFKIFKQMGENTNAYTTLFSFIYSALHANTNNAAVFSSSDLTSLINNTGKKDPNNLNQTDVHIINIPQNGLTVLDAAPTSNQPIPGGDKKSAPLYINVTGTSQTLFLTTPSELNRLGYNTQFYINACLASKSVGFSSNNTDIINTTLAPGKIGEVYVNTPSNTRVEYTFTCKKPTLAHTRGRILREFNLVANNAFPNTKNLTIDTKDYLAICENEDCQ